MRVLIANKRFDRVFQMRTRSTSLRVMVLGIRGFPNVQGGIEKHAERLCPLLNRMGCDVEAIVRARYVLRGSGERWKGVRLRRVWSPKSRCFETIVHTLLGVLIAAWKRPDILHIHAVGPAIIVPLARLLGLHVVVTHHGPDYEREKWGPLAKLILRAGEAFGMRLAHQRIAVSEGIKNLVQTKYRVDCEFIPNGVDLPELPTTQSALFQFGLVPGRYVLMVSRLVPEKRHTDLIAAFGNAGLDGWKLALVGAADHQTQYAQTVAELAGKDPAVVVTGFQHGIALCELYAHAGVFVLPSSHEGLPVALLEALSYGLPVIASDIPANLEIGLERAHYFAATDVSALTEKLRAFAGEPWSAENRQTTRRWLAQKQNWLSVAEHTLSCYRKAPTRERLRRWGYVGAAAEGYGRSAIGDH
jgi:glycosyltransferase involved in cell wall biosynthesis